MGLFPHVPLSGRFLHRREQKTYPNGHCDTSLCVVVAMEQRRENESDKWPPVFHPQNDMKRHNFIPSPEPRQKRKDKQALPFLGNEN